MIELPIMGLKKLKIKKLINFADKRPLIVFIFLAVIVFFLFRDLFSSYFEADEWFHYTYYFPLTRKPDGFLTAIISTIISSGPLSAGQHVIPVASAIYFLNTKFFGLNYAPYAFMSLLLHSINSFLVFLIMRAFLDKREVVTKNIFALLSGLFFALSPQPSHAITGAAPFYGQNILSVTFFLLCIFSFKLAYIRKNKKLIYLSILFLFLALFTKETAVFLFGLLPFMVIIEKKIFPLKFLAKLFVICLIVYVIFRFLVPNVYQGVGPLVDRLIGNYVSSSLPSWQKQSVQEITTSDTGTIVSRDLSFYKNVPGEVILRTVTFPFRMTGTLFFPRPTVFSIVEFITPIVVPLPDSSARLSFSYGAGNFSVIYLAALGILIFCTKLIIKFIRKGYLDDVRALVTGLAIIVLSTLPLVAIMFSFPRWGYDFYFDSRFYYNPNVGAAIVFPFLILGIANFLSKAIRREAFFPMIAILVFIVWLINNIIVLKGDIRYNTQNFQPDRREVVTQLKDHLPKLPEKIVFYMETDGLSAYGPKLPFQTGVPQALTVIYYDRSPLPDSFFNKALFDGMPQGYSNSQDKGFGYYTSKKDLSEALILRKFELSDVHAFYYKSLKGKLLDKTLQVRKEMQDYLNQTDIPDWRKFNGPSLGIKFLYPQLTKVEDLKITDTNTIKSLLLKDPEFSAEIFAITVSPAFNIHDNIQFPSQKDGVPLIFQDTIEKNVFFDKYRSNKLTVTNEDMPRYFIKFNDILIYIKIGNSSPEGLRIIERILGSLEIIDEK